MKTVDRMLVMDVDGTITNLTTKKANPQILSFIAGKLKTQPFAFNTGRSIEWVQNAVLNPLMKEFSMKQELQNLFVIGEKGAVWISFGEDGKEKKHIDREYSVPQELQEEICALAKTYYSDSMFYDPKHSMVSIEMKDGYDRISYQKQQSLLIQQIKHLVRKRGLEDKLRVDSNQIAIDVQDKRVGKDLGVTRLLNWLKERKIKVKSFTTIGDNLSDIKMAEELHKNNFSVIHVHVGEKKIEGKMPFKIITTGGHYENGTLEFLKTI